VAAPILQSKSLHMVTFPASPLNTWLRCTDIRAGNGVGSSPCPPCPPLSRAAMTRSASLTLVTMGFSVQRCNPARRQRGFDRRAECGESESSPHQAHLRRSTLGNRCIPWHRRWTGASPWLGRFCSALVSAIDTPWLRALEAGCRYEASESSDADQADAKRVHG